MSLDEIVHDHAEIERTASALRKLAAEPSTSLDELGAAVSTFEAAMVKHFGQEEAELFPRLREVAPDLVERLDALERQHAEMRDALDALAAAADEDRVKAAALMEALWTALDAHASEEADILSVTRDDAFPGQVEPG